MSHIDALDDLDDAQTEIRELKKKIARLRKERDELKAQVDDLSMSEFCTCGLQFVTNDAGGRICIECDVEDCPKCGAAEFVEQNNIVACRDCGYRETLSETKKMTDENLLKECRVGVPMGSSPRPMTRGVTVRHIPTGLLMVHKGETTQHRNLKAALKELRKRVALLEDSS